MPCRLKASIQHSYSGQADRIRPDMRYFKTDKKFLKFKSTKGQSVSIRVDNVEKAIIDTHKVIDKIYEYKVDILRVLGMRNASSFIGELFAARLDQATKPKFIPNPHQDGYPDLLLMDQFGKALIRKIRKNGQWQDKKPFSPFKNGGLEIKATCGDVPTPAVCRARGAEGKPNIGDQRIDLVTGYLWKAHHRNTSTLIGLLWDFVEGRARIVAVFFCPRLINSDWGEIVKPKTGGGRTTSVSNMSPKGQRKMYQGWLLVYKDDPRYSAIINALNGGFLIP